MVTHRLLGDDAAMTRLLLGVSFHALSNLAANNAQSLAETEIAPCEQYRHTSSSDYYSATSPVQYQRTVRKSFVIDQISRTTRKCLRTMMVLKESVTL